MKVLSLIAMLQAMVIRGVLQDNILLVLRFYVILYLVAEKNFTVFVLCRHF